MHYWKSILWEEQQHVEITFPFISLGYTSQGCQENEQLYEAVLWVMTEDNGKSCNRVDLCSFGATNCPSYQHTNHFKATEMNEKTFVLSLIEGARKVGQLINPFRINKFVFCFNSQLFHIAINSSILLVLAFAPSLVFYFRSLGHYILIPLPWCITAQRGGGYGPRNGLMN